MIGIWINDSYNSNILGNTESLKILVPSIISQPSIQKTKQKSKKQRTKEIIELAKEIELPSQKKQENNDIRNNSNNNIIKKVKIIGDQKRYDIVHDVGDTVANITIGQLLDLNPKLRTELSKSLKLTTMTTINEAIYNEEDILSTIKQDKIVKTHGKVEGVDTIIYLDSCSSINLITKSFLIKNNINISPLSQIKETFLQAFNNETIVSKLFEIEITIGDITLKEIFRLIEKDDIFNVLIGVDTLRHMKLIIDFTDNNLYQKLDDIKKIGSIENVSTLHYEEFNNDFNDLNSNDNVNEINYLKGNNSNELYCDNKNNDLNKNNGLNKNKNSNKNKNLNKSNNFNKENGLNNGLNKNENFNKNIKPNNNKNSLNLNEDIDLDKNKNLTNNNNNIDSNENFDFNINININRNDDFIDINKNNVINSKNENFLNNNYIENDEAAKEYLLCTQDQYEKIFINDNKNKSKEELIEEIIEGTDEDKRQALKQLLENNEELLAISTDDLGKSKLLAHEIKLNPNQKPIKQRKYRIADKKKMEILREEIQKLRDNGLIEPSQSSWSFPVVLVPKNNGTWRMCVDYRKLNDITEKDAYPLPYIEEILYSVGNDVKFLSTLDLFSGFHQIPMKKEDRDKTCFTTIYGNYNFKVMPFGLCNAPATFQREMNRIFLPLIGKCMFVYMDDLVIFSCSLEEHLKNLQDIFNIIKENGLKVNLSKCHFLKKEVQVLGHLLTTEGIKTVQKKVDSIKIMKSPTNLTQLRSFLGAVGYYRKFIKNYSSIAQPLYKLQKKNTKFQWTQTEENAFRELKEKLVKAPILSFPNFDKQFIIRTDASYDGLGGVLIQKDNEGVEHPIFYVSRTLKKYELNYSVTDIEGTAAFYCTKKFK